MEDIIKYLISIIKYLISIIKYLISIILPIFTGWLGWYLRGRSEKKKRTTEISDLAKLLKMSIVYMADVAVKKVDIDYDNYYLTKSPKKIRGIPKNLDEFYKASIDKLGILDESLIVKVKRYHERFEEWEEKHRELYHYSHLATKSIPLINKMVDKCKYLADRIIKKARELEKELDKKIKEE